LKGLTFNGKPIKPEQIDNILKNAEKCGLRINLNAGEILSLVSPKVEKDNILASKIKFSSDKAMELDIKSVQKTTPDDLKNHKGDLTANSTIEYFKFTDTNIPNLRRDIRLNKDDIDKLENYIRDKKLVNKEMNTDEFMTLLQEAKDDKGNPLFNFEETQINAIMDGIYSSHNNQWTEAEINRYVRDNKSKMDEYEKAIGERLGKPPISEKSKQEIAKFILKWEEAKGQYDKFNAVNPNENKQSEGVFEEYNYNMNGEITFSNRKNNYIAITNKNTEKGKDGKDKETNNIEAAGKDSNDTPIANKGGFYQTLHYKLKINDPPGNLSENYQLLFIPGGGGVTFGDKTAYPGSPEQSGITMPIKISKDDKGVPHIIFDYKIEGGSSLPVYVLIVPKL